MNRYLLPCLIFLWFLSACSSHKTRIVDTPETRGLKGWEKPYVVNGERYDPLRSHEGFVQEGRASWYGDDFHGKPTSNGETYDMHALTAAHKTLPLGVFVRVQNKENGREVVVRVNDRGPFVRERIIDLSYTAARQLGIAETGTAPVRVEALGFRVTGRDGDAAYRSQESYDHGRFAVQIASFADPDNAGRLVAVMKKKHGSAGIQEGTVNGRRLYRVRVGNFDSLAGSEAARKKFEIDGYSGSFVVALD